MRSTVFLMAATLLAGCDDDPALTIPANCNPLAMPGSRCMVPWPSSAFEIADDSTATKRRLAIPERTLPETYDKIRQGGPFPYEKDGVVFGNRERLLPAEKRGYYREYTVNTPGLGHRGTRRIVCGGMPRTPDSCYYTADHYASFRRIVP